MLFHYFLIYNIVIQLYFNKNDEIIEEKKYFLSYNFLEMRKDGAMSKLFHRK